MDDSTQEAIDQYNLEIKLKPLCYVTLLPLLTYTAQKHGYSLGVHGSMVRDLDLIAVPWTEEAVEASELIDALTKAIEGRIIAYPTVGTGPTLKPHGRLAWSIQVGFTTWLDVSVMPRMP